MEPKAKKREESLFLGLLFVCSLAFFIGMAAVIAPLGLLVVLLFGIGLISVEFSTSAMLSIWLLSFFGGFWFAYKMGREHYEERLMWRKLRNKRD